MENIAKALVVATQFIADRNARADEDRDVEQLEYIASLLAGASGPERRALQAASRALGFSNWSEQIGVASDINGDA